MGNRISYRSRHISSYTEVLNKDRGVIGTTDMTSSVAWYDERIAKDNPKYKELIAAGQCATNFLEATKKEVRILHPGGFEMMVVGDNRAKGTRAKSTWMGIQVPDASVDSYSARLLECEDMAALGIRKRIRETINSMSGLTFLGELRESVKMLKHPATGLEHLLRKFIGDANPVAWKRKQHRAGVRNASKTHYVRDLGDMWLEFAFGWSPLASDLKELAELALAQMSVDNVKRCRYRSHLDSDVETDFGYSSVIEARIGIHRFKRTGCDVNFIAGVRRKVDSEALGGLDHLISQSFDLSDVVPTAWELLPWSFFIDYFSNIGDVLSANYVSMSDVVWSQRTRRIETTRLSLSGAAESYDPATFVITRNDARAIETTASWVERMAAVIPYVTVRFELPTAPVKFVNMIALLASQKKTSFS